MIIFFTVIVGTLIVGAILWIVYFFRLNEKIMETLTLIFTIMIGTVIICGVDIGIQRFRDGAKLSELEQRRKDIITRLERDDRYAGDDMTDFNAELAEGKYWAENIWVGWFNSQAYSKVDYIEIITEEIVYIGT